MRNKFSAQLELLSEKLILMGNMIESAIANAVCILNRRDETLARRALEYELEIDRAEKDIESLCMRLLLEQQPVAGDLRLISAALKMITDMERIGDQAYDISEIAVSAEGNVPPHISAMAGGAINMVNCSIEAFVEKDVELAARVIRLDDKVDALFEEVKHELAQRIQNNPECCGGALDLLLTAKYLQRIGDHAENIAEWVLYELTGRRDSVQ